MSVIAQKNAPVEAISYSSAVSLAMSNVASIAAISASRLLLVVNERFGQHLSAATYCISFPALSISYS